MAADLISVPNVLLDRLADAGIEAARLLRTAGLSPSRFGSGKANLTTREFFAFWRAAQDLVQAPDLGLRLGSETAPHRLSVASLAALHSPNLGEALQKVARYKRLCSAEEVQIAVSDGEARLSFHWVHAVETLPMLLVDATFASFLALAREGTGLNITPLRVELARRPANEALLTEHFGCEVSFDAPLDVLVFDEAALVRPFVTQNADVCAVMAPGLEAALHEQLTSRSIADDVSSTLRRAMSGQRPSVEKVAAEMHMSLRTLQRRLGEVGTSYQQLLDGVRRDTARRLLLHTGLEAGEIAFLLGFDELNSFTRAFHAWEGTTPIRWRAIR